MDRQACIDLVEQSYFGNMTRARPDLILALFEPGATITSFYGATPCRIMRAEPGPGEESMADFFGKAVDTFDVAYSDFVNVVDVEAQRIWSMYTLHIGPKPDGPKHGEPTRELRNSNFFELANGKIKAVTVYFANPPAIPKR